MIDLQTIRNTPEHAQAALEQKGIAMHEKAEEIILQIAELDRCHRAKLTELQDAQAEANAVSDDIGALMANGNREEAQTRIKLAADLKTDIEALEAEAADLKESLREQLLAVPNVPHESVPVGSTPDENLVAHVGGQKPTFDAFRKAEKSDGERHDGLPDGVLPHWTLAERHGLVDFERGAKVTGAGFPFYVGGGARLQRAIVNFFLDEAATRGYREVQPPVFVNEDSAFGTGQLPDKEDLMYEVPRDGFYPVPTAEVPVTNFHRGEILAAEDLPVQFCAFTPCFRREAGSYGQHVRGLNRLHQFDKVELVRIVRPENSYEALEALREDAERLLRLLNLPYRRLLMCTGDMGFAQAKKYDLEVWSAGQEKWLEVSSISNFEAFQARRMQIRYRAEPEAKPELVHTLNGSGLALPRVVAALLEHGQRPDGTIQIPDVLQPYMGCEHLTL